MTGSAIVILGTLIVVCIAAVVIPGGEFAVPLFLLVLLLWGVHRYRHARRESRSAEPPS